MTEVLTGLDGGDRERIGALRANGRFFWLDASLSETSRDDLIDTLGISERVFGGALARPRRREVRPLRAQMLCRHGSARQTGLPTA